MRMFEPSSKRTKLGEQVIVYWVAKRTSDVNRQVHHVLFEQSQLTPTYVQAA